MSFSVKQGEGLDPCPPKTRPLQSLLEVRTMPIATLTSKGQITLPKEVRDHFHLETGDRVEFLIRSDGAVQMLPVRGSFHALRGMVWRPGLVAPTDAEMVQELIETIAADDERIRRGDG